jgi:hypothetical protein
MGIFFKKLYRELMDRIERNLLRPFRSAIFFSIEDAQSAVNIGPSGISTANLWSTRNGLKLIAVRKTPVSCLCVSRKVLGGSGTPTIHPRLGQPTINGRRIVPLRVEM